MSRPLTPLPHSARSPTRRRILVSFLKTRTLYLIGTIVVLALAGWFAISISQASSGTPSFAPSANISVGTNPRAVAVGDFNGDNKLDLAVANSGSGNLSILLGDGAGSFGAATNFPAGVTPVSIAVGDFNSDSKLDLAVANSGGPSDPGNISIMLGDGTGNFGAPTNLSVGMHPYAVVTADFNADTKLDLAVANYDSNNISVLVGNGLGGFSAATNFTVGTNPRAIALGDFNIDGKLDFAVANQASNNVSILLGDGAGSFSSALNFAAGTGPVSVATGDLNGDTKPDLMVANLTSGNISVLLGDGLGSFAGATNFTAGTNPFSVVTGDFYGDGKLDVAVANSGAANVSVLLGDGTGSLGAPTNFAVGTDPRILSAGNFNGDSKLDLAVPNFGSNNISVLLNTSVVTAVVSGTVKDTQGNPVSGATVGAINPSSQQVVASTTSDGVGHYSLTVLVGTYDLKTTPPTGSELVPETIQNLSLVSDINQDITLQRGTTVSGRIVDQANQPVVNLNVQLNAVDGNGTVAETFTTGDGSYSLRVAPGTYRFYLNTFFGPANSTNVPEFARNEPPLSVTQDTIHNVTLPTRILSGTVKDTNGQPVAGVRLSYISQYSDQDGVVWTVNPAEAFTLADGSYRLILFARPSLGPIIVTPPANSGLGSQPINNLDMQQDRVLDIILSSVLLSGRIVDQANQPVVNLNVQLKPVNSSGVVTIVETFTAGDGSYSLRVAPGTYRFDLNTFFGPANSTNVPEFLRIEPQLSVTQDTVHNVTLPTRILSGTVKNTNGQPVAGVRLSFMDGPLYTDADGIGWVINPAEAFTLADGSYRLILFARPSIGPIIVTPPANSGLGNQSISKLDMQQDRALDIILSSVRLSGRVVDRDNQPVVNLNVQLNAADGRGTIAETFTAGDGSYSLLVGPGTYRFDLNTFFGPANSTNVPEFDRSEPPLSITQDTVHNVTLPTRILSGTVKDTNGQPVAGVRLSFRDGPVYTDADGDWVINPAEAFTLADGSYRLVLFARPSLGPIIVTPPANSGLAVKNIGNVDMQQDRTLDIVLQSPVANIRGRVTDQNGNPITGVTMTLSGSQSAISTTDGNGNYQFVNVSEGSNYTVTPSRTSYSFNPGNAVFNNLTGDQIANFAGTLFTFNVIGHVRDGSSVGIGGVTVTLSGATTAVTQTDNSGAYAFNNVAAFANYSAKASKPNFTVTPARVDISNLSANQIVDFTTAAQPSPTPTPPLDDDFGSAQRNPDKFNFGSLSTDPTAFDPLVSVAQQNGHLEIKPRADAFGTHYNGYTTVGAVDLNAGNASVEVVQAATGGAQTIFSLGSDRDNSFGFMVQTANSGPIASRADGERPLDAALLIFQIKISGQLTALSIPYDPVAHRFWRFRYDASPNSILFETSADNAAWVVRHSVVLTKAVTPMAVELSSGTSSTTTTPGTAVFDNFHLGDKFTIGGQVKTAGSVAVSGVLISLSGTLIRTATTDGSGSYSFAQVDAGGNYTVTPSFSNYTFSPASQIFNSLAANKTADFVATTDTTPTPTPTPTPTGYTPTGSNVTVQGNGVEITFAQVNSAGITSMNSINPASAGSMPGGYVINGSSVAFDLGTTASYTPPIDLCFAMPSVTDATAFSVLAVMHNEGGTLIDRTTTRDFAAKKVCGRVSSLSPFAVVSKITLQYSAATFNGGENIGSVSLTVIRTSDSSSATTINYATSDTAGSSNCNTLNTGVANSRCDYETTAGTLTFAAGELSKTILIPFIDDVYAEGSESFTVTLSNATGASLGSPSVATVNITDNETTTGTNPIDQANFFVRLHYIDFLNREPDAGGLAFWSNQITECQQPGATCNADVRRINVSAAFFLSIEFQETGYLVYRIYKAAYGNVPGLPVPLKLNEFLPDTQEIGQGVIVGQTGWEQVLENNKQAFALDFVSRSRFTTAYPTSRTPAQFVDALFANAAVTPSTADRAAAINEFGSATNTADTAARGRALRRVAENSTLNRQEFNRAFVLEQYFGYLRRNPNDAPDSDFGGYNFWLGKLNEFNGNFVNAEMVKAFIVSGEYKQRFGP